MDQGFRVSKGLKGYYGHGQVSHFGISYHELSGLALGSPLMQHPPKIESGPEPLESKHHIPRQSPIVSDFWRLRLKPRLHVVASEYRSYEFLETSM